MISEYIETSFGKVPKDWQISKIEEIADVKGGKRLPKGESLTEVKTNHPYIRVADMYFGGVDTKNLLYVPEHVFPTIKNYIIGKDDLFISVAGTLGIVGEIPIKLDGANLTENADRLTNISINKSFLLQVLLSPIIQNAIEREQTNNAQPKLALSRIRAFEIPNPSLPEQQKIAEILSTVDDKIEVIDQQIIETQELKKGLMQRLLTKGIGHTEFKDSPLGMIPKSWEVSKISEIADINKRSLPNTTYDDFEFYYIDLSAVKSGTIEFPTEKVRYCNSPSRARRVLNHGDVIMATVRPNLLGIGFADFKTDEFICSTGFALISHKDNSDGKYIFQNLYSENVQSQINKLIVGSNYPAINSSDVQNIKIPMPPLLEQKKIAEILSSVDDKLRVLSQKKTHNYELKQGLMQQLLTGKIRVKI